MLQRWSCMSWNCISRPRSSESCFGTRIDPPSAARFPAPLQSQTTYPPPGPGDGSDARRNLRPESQTGSPEADFDENQRNRHRVPRVQICKPWPQGGGSGERSPIDRHPIGLRLPAADDLLDTRITPRESGGGGGEMLDIWRKIPLRLGGIWANTPSIPQQRSEIYSPKHFRGELHASAGQIRQHGRIFCRHWRNRADLVGT